LLLHLLRAFLDIWNIPIGLISLQGVDIISDLAEQVLGLRDAPFVITRVSSSYCLLIFSRSGYSMSALCSVDTTLARNQA
jgi:hypothetical protein